MAEDAASLNADTVIAFLGSLDDEQRVFLSQHAREFVLGVRAMSNEVANGMVRLLRALASDTELR